MLQSHNRGVSCYFTGGRGADPQALAQDMQQAVSKFADRARSVKEVRVVVFQEQMLQPYIAAFNPSVAVRGAEGPGNQRQLIHAYHLLLSELPKGYHVFPLLRSWHGLPITQRVDYKLSFL